MLSVDPGQPVERADVDVNQARGRYRANGRLLSCNGEVILKNLSGFAYQLMRPVQVDRRVVFADDFRDGVQLTVQILSGVACDRGDKPIRV